MGKGADDLMRAARYGNMAELRRFLDEGESAESRDALGMTLLLQAARHGRAESVRFLISRGVDVEARDFNGGSVLSFAIRGSAGGSNEEMEGLASDLADSTKIGVGMKSDALEDAVRYGSLSILERLAKKPGIDLNRRGSSGETPLHCAIRLGERKKALRLIDAGADVNACDDAGVPLLFAALDDFEMFDKLAFWGANVNVSHSEGIGFAWHWADRELAREEANRRGGKASGTGASLSKTLRKALEMGWDVDSKDGRGRTLLHLAAEWGLGSAATKLILKSGADPSIRDDEGRTPAESARVAGSEETAKLLEDAVSRHSKNG